MSGLRIKGFLVVAFVVFFSVVAVLVLLPDVWFKNRLKENWSADETSLPTASKKGRRNRLCLVFAIDGVPYGMIRELKKEGYFQGFYPPGRLVSTFPSLTRPAFSKMLIGGKPYGYERKYYNFFENRLEGDNLIKKAFSTQSDPAGYHPKLHFLGFPGYIAYVFPNKFTQTALDAFKVRLKNFEGDEFIAYMGISDAIAHVFGERALKEFVKKISDLLDSVRMDLGIALDVVLFSDHANNFSMNQRVDLSTPLELAGFRNVEYLEGEKDFVLPENGFVSFAALYTADDNASSIARVLSSIEGVDFSVYRSGTAVVVEGKKGMARIIRRQDRFGYIPIDGDPLDLENTKIRLIHLGKSDGSGFIHERDWWQATQNHPYPDPLRRLWEGIHDLVQHPATILVSLTDGYAFGPVIFNQSVINPRAGTHGALLGSHSYGFLMTDFMTVNPASRPADVANLLQRATEAKNSGEKLPYAGTN